MIHARDHASLARDKICATALRRLDETGALLAIAAPTLAPRAAVLKPRDDGWRAIALVDRRTVAYLAAQGWVDLSAEGPRVTVYTISEAGRAWLRAALDSHDRARIAARRVA